MQGYSHTAFSDKLRHILFIYSIILLALLQIFSTPLAFAYNQDLWIQNYIIGYDPDEVNCTPTTTNPSSDGTSNGSSSYSGSGYDRLKNAIREHYQSAMNAQKQYGTPWKVVFAQMQIESQVGQTGIAVHGATNNYLGITGSGDTGTWVSSSGRHWAKFSSVGASIPFWSGTRVLRNGYYDDAFQYLDPNNYNLHAFLVRMIHHYAPSSDGNNESAYVSNIENLIQGPIAEVRQELSLPNSEEYAKREVIPIGGSYPLGSTGELADININYGNPSNTQNNVCLSSSSGGLSAGGFTTLEAAQAFMDEYFSVPPSDFVKYNMNSGGGCAGGIKYKCLYR